MFRSTDNGNNWTEVNNGLSDIDIRALVLNSTGYLFAGSDGEGLFKSTNNGNDWITLKNSLPMLSIYSLAVNHDGHIFAGGNYRSTDNGESWIKNNNELAYFAWSLGVNAYGDIFAGTYGQGIYRSTDNGDNWMEINNGLTESFIPSFAINSSGNVFAGTGNGVFRSRDNGDSWTKVGLTGNYVFSLAVSPNGHIFAGSGDPSTFFPSEEARLFRSTDNGDNWSQVQQIDSSAFLALAINSNGHIFAGAKLKGIFISTDDGENWFEENEGLTNTDILSLAIDTSGHVFVGTYGGGVFRSIYSTTSNNPLLALSSDSCKIWEANKLKEINWVSSDIENIKLEYTTNDANWYTIVPSFSAFKESYYWLVPNAPSQFCKIKISDTQNPSVSDVTSEFFTINSVFEDQNKLLMSFQLFQNYPNPFNPMTKIKYSIPKQSYVTLKVYDILGNEIETLANEEKPAGEYEVTLDAVNLPSGVYFYRLQAGSFVKTKKMILLK